ncbi:MAG: TrkH family potassium uptake protein [Flavobacteriales bacterium]|nr:TrkH family potassium uptake protein [Flavobacteriales bacterium]
MLNWKVILNILGSLLMLNGFFMAFGIPVSLYYGEGGLIPILLSAAFTGNLGFLLWFVTRKGEKTLRTKDGYIIVTAGWLVMSLSGSLPYMLSGAIPQFSSALFETISGYTTTGSSTLSDIEALPKGILFWRSLTQWIGGMGIIVLTVAILPLLGVGGMQLFMAESPGPSADKLHPRITETAKRLWLIYVGLTIVESVLLKMFGMNWYDAVNHAMTTVSTGGFSTMNASIAAYDSPAIHYTISLFMFFGGLNFTLIYFFLKGRVSRVFENEEFRYYLGILVLSITAGMISLQQMFPDRWSQNLDEIVFQVVSILTTTGFATADYTAWSPFLVLMFFILMFFGASAGSTSGGLKIVRHVIITKNGLSELKRLIHPSAVVPVRYNGKAVGQKITYNILAFFFIYLGVFLIGTIVMTMYNYDLLTAAGATISSLGNIGPGIGMVGPMYNFSQFPESAKLILAFTMLLGRLELFTILLLFSRHYWRKV